MYTFSLACCLVLFSLLYQTLEVAGAALQVADLRKKIEEEQRMLMQWSEERLALAQSLLGLLELHVTQANKDIAAFDGELQVCQCPIVPLFPRAQAASAIINARKLCAIMAA